jgi:hypothetical protein
MWWPAARFGSVFNFLVSFQDVVVVDDGSADRFLTFPTVRVGRIKM